MEKTGRPKKETEQICTRFEIDDVLALDELRKTEKDLPSRPEMLRRVLSRYVKDHSE